MPIHLPFNFPYKYIPNPNNYYHNISNKPNNFKKDNNTNTENKHEKKVNCDENTDYFFEILGLRLYLDDIIIICILFFLYTEGVKDNELFICLILLLLS